MPTPDDVTGAAMTPAQLIVEMDVLNRLARAGAPSRVCDAIFRWKDRVIRDCLFQVPARVEPVFRLDSAMVARQYVRVTWLLPRSVPWLTPLAKWPTDRFKPAGQPARDEDRPLVRPGLYRTLRAFNALETHYGPENLPIHLFSERLQRRGDQEPARTFLIHRTAGVLL